MLARLRDRSTKVDASDLDAFASQNYSLLAHVGVDYVVAWEKVLPTPSGDFSVDTRFEQNVGVLTLFPGDCYRHRFLTCCSCRLKFSLVLEFSSTSDRL